MSTELEEVKKSGQHAQMTHEAATCLRQLRDENSSLKQKEQANKEATLQL